MIVVDTSALVAILQEEPERAKFLQAIERAPDRFAPASCYVESVMVLSRREDGRGRLDAFLGLAGMAVLGSDPHQARLAADAFERFGRGSGHPAKLNFGDCLAYAAAKFLDAPLLFKGEDFGRTDIRPALAGA